MEFVDQTLETLLASDSVEPKLKQALANRLGFRAAFLGTVSTVEDRTSPFAVKAAWTSALEILPSIKAEADLAKPVSEAFSAKIQRKLASTVPPRPVVSVAYQDAFKHLERLCKDGLILTEVLNFHDSHTLMVSIAS